MKLTFLFIILSFTCLAGKSFDFKVQIQDAITNKPLEGIEVKLQNGNAITVSAFTDSTGSAQFTIDFRKFQITISDTQNSYQGGYSSRMQEWQVKKKEDEGCLIELHPSIELYRRYQNQVVADFLKDKDTITLVDTTCTTSVEATFPGGQRQFNMYLIENLQYPADAIEQNVQGRVFIQFIVERDGSITDVKILRGVSQSLDREALRLIREMPHWMPGYCKENRQLQRTKVTLPINFTLN